MVIYQLHSDTSKTQSASSECKLLWPEVSRPQSDTQGWPVGYVVAGI